MWSSGPARQRSRLRAETTTNSGAGLIRRALTLLNSAADGAGDEDVTPSEIAEVIRDALESPDPDLQAKKVRGYLVEALDAVSDGMPADYSAMFMYAALGALEAD